MFIDDTMRTDGVVAFLSTVSGIIIGIVSIAKDMVYANVAENVNSIAHNTFSN